MEHAYGHRATEAAGDHPLGPMGKGGALPSAEILIVFAITALLYVDTSVSVPSLYQYVQQVITRQHRQHRPASGQHPRTLAQIN